MDTIAKARRELLKEFRESSKRTAANVANAWLTLEQDPANEETRSQIMRMLHSLKGEARLMGYRDVMSLAHDAEELVLATANMDADAVSEAGDVLLATCDFISTRTLGQADPTPNDEDETATLQEQIYALVSRFGSRSHNGERQKIDDPEDSETAKSSGDDAKEAGAGKGEPDAPEPARASDTSTSTRTTVALDAKPSASGAEATEGSVRVDLTLASDISLATGELVLSHQRCERIVKHLRRLVSELDNRSDTAERGGRKHAAGRDTTSLTAGIAEAVGALQVLLQEGALRARSLDERARTLRLIPLRRVLEKYARAVRDIAKDLGKKVELLVDDGGLSVDASVAERISEPLLHLVRNAVDHGIETPKQRVAAGKSERGVLSLSASPDGPRIRLMVQDDGRGIDTEHVKQRALEKGLVSEAELHDEAFGDGAELLFKRGFSTKAAANDLSGRGVGLDVVKHEIETLGGLVRLQHWPKKGCSFTLLVPASVALTRVLVVNVGESHFALPSRSVATVFRTSTAKHELVNGRPTIRFEGRALPLVELGQLLGAKWGGSGTDAAIVVSHEAGAAALAVTGWQGHSEVAVRPLGDMLAPARIVAGCAVLDSGDLTLVLNPAVLLAEVAGAREAVFVERTKLGVRASGLAGGRILVAEDSAITRTLVVHVLRSFGYEVIEAVDGIDALAQLTNTPVDLILTDVDMPNMDGPALIRRVRSDATHTRIPIVVLTSRASASDRKVASDAGADAYLVKADFSESALRRVVADQLGRP